MKKLDVVRPLPKSRARSATPVARLPRRYAPALFGLLLSGLMSLLVSGIATLRATGVTDGFAGAWAGAWLMAWLVAFPVVLVVAPRARRLVERLVAQP